jgi:hypothetical protein
MRRTTTWRTVFVAPIICAVAGGVAGCHRTVEGTAVAAEIANHTTVTTTTSQAPRALPVAALEGLLLSADQVIALVGGTNMALVGTAISASDASKMIDDRTCLGLGSVGDVMVYIQQRLCRDAWQPVQHAQRRSGRCHPARDIVCRRRRCPGFAAAGPAGLARMREPAIRLSLVERQPQLLRHSRLARRWLPHRIVDASRRRCQVGMLARDGGRQLRRRRTAGLLARQGHHPVVNNLLDQIVAKVPQ